MNGRLTFLNLPEMGNWDTSPFSPWGPGSPGVPGCPGSPLTPIFPWGPIGPGAPGNPVSPRSPLGPTLPSLPGSPGSPIGPGNEYSRVKRDGYTHFSIHTTANACNSPNSQTLRVHGHLCHHFKMNHNQNEGNDVYTECFAYLYLRVNLGILSPPGFLVALGIRALPVHRADPLALGDRERHLYPEDQFCFLYSISKQHTKWKPVQQIRQTCFFHMCVLINWLGFVSYLFSLNIYVYLYFNAVQC